MESHRHHAVATNNRAWDLIEMPNLSLEQVIDLLSCAWASLYHWSMMDAFAEIARAHGTVARALTVANRTEEALPHAQKYLQFANTEDAEAWDPYFAHSGMARILASMDQFEDARIAAERARMALQKLEGEDRQICEKDFSIGPWFELDLDPV